MTLTFLRLKALSSSFSTPRMFFTGMMHNASFPGHKHKHAFIHEVKTANRKIHIFITLQKNFECNLIWKCSHRPVFESVWDFFSQTHIDKLLGKALHKQMLDNPLTWSGQTASPSPPIQTHGCFSCAFYMFDQFLFYPFSWWTLFVPQRSQNTQMLENQNHIQTFSRFKRCQTLLSDIQIIFTNVW